jgi:nucleoside-diphosphate-sugar epimerase
MAIAYAKDFPVKTRIARYHNVYGPRGERAREGG